MSVTHRPPLQGRLSGGPGLPTEAREGTAVSGRHRRARQASARPVLAGGRARRAALGQEDGNRPTALPPQRLDPAAPASAWRTEHGAGRAGPLPAGGVKKPVWVLPIYLFICAVLTHK